MKLTEPIQVKQGASRETPTEAIRTASKEDLIMSSSVPNHGQKVITIKGLRIIIHWISFEYPSQPCPASHANFPRSKVQTLDLYRQGFVFVLKRSLGKKM